jgi:hypothetical protein
MGRNEEALSDVRRKIGEVMHKDANKIQVGWNAPHIERKEGDIWTDHDGKKWTRKNGLIQSITKLDGAKMPWWCPKCNTPLNNQIHKRAWQKLGVCFNCLAHEETELKRTGQFERVLREKQKQSSIDWIKDKIQELQDYYDNVSVPEMIHADNEKILMIEKWDIDLATVRKDLQEEIDKLKEHLTKIEAGELDEATN